jgi:hypothetical protein
MLSVSFASMSRSAFRINANQCQGIYVTDSQAKAIGLSNGFGIRLEDPIVVGIDIGDVLTGGRAWSPWQP